MKHQILRAHTARRRAQVARRFAAALCIVAGSGFLANAAVADATSDAIEAVTKRITGQTNGTPPNSVRATPLDGIYEVVYGSEVLYVSADGRYMLRGDMIDLDQRMNLTEDVRRIARRDVVNNLDEKSMIVYAGAKQADQVQPADGAQSKIVTIFTDVDCGYCARLHRQMADYNSRGITIRYLAFPRAGIPSESYSKTVSVWCSDDQRDAITKAKAGTAIPAAECENPVEAHYLAGQSLGVRGTPTIVLDDGTVLPGYLPPDQLERVLNGEAS